MSSSKTKMENNQRRLNTRVFISNFPNGSIGEVEKLAASFGSVLKFEPNNEGGVVATYDDPTTAKEALDKFKEATVAGSKVQVEFYTTRRNLRSRSTEDFPVRLMVPSDLVGAVIGRKGECIKEITQRSHARVDVTRHDAPGMTEKLITIYGTTDSCMAACKEIMEVLNRESSAGGREINIRMLAHNGHVGRLIGKGGATVRKIMEETNTKIAVTNTQEFGAFSVCRIVQIKGTLEGQVTAARDIHEKLKGCYEKDVQQSNVPFGGGMAMGPAGPMGFMGPMGFGQYGPQVGSGGGFALQAGPNRPAAPQPDVETAYLYVPSTAVGAIIGAQGRNIRTIMDHSRARVKVETKDNEDDDNVTSRGVSADLRQVIITGTPEAQWRAQFYIFDKLHSEGYSTGGDGTTRLLCEISVPKTLVGRIIGKNGQTVRELQQHTGARIMLPEKPVSQQGDEVRVQIDGNFFSSQMAQRRLRAIVATSDRNPPAGRLGNAQTGSGVPDKQSPAQNHGTAAE